jgi:hypothetical protein
VRWTSSRLIRSARSERAADKTWPVQLVISAVVSPLGDPSTRNSLICFAAHNDVVAAFIDPAAA